MIIGDAVVPTGYSRMIRKIFEPIRHEYQITHLATRYDGATHDYPWELIPAVDYGDVYGLTRLDECVDRVRPDIVFIMYDLSYQDRYVARIRAAVARPKIVVYSPIESGPIEPEILDRLGDVSRYVVFGDEARDVVHHASARPYRSEPTFAAEVVVIPHGVDTTDFFPIEGGQREARRRLGLIGVGLEDAFIVFNGNRNLVKKRLDITIEGFARFAADKPADVKLLIHAETEGTGFNLDVLARRFGVGDRLIRTSEGAGVPNLSTADLNLVYNACDVGVNTSISEGWGLVSFEHAATRHAQIVPASPCLRQLWGSNAVLIEPSAIITNPGLLTNSHLVAAGDLATALEMLYDDPARRHKMADLAFRHATRPELSWPVIGQQWTRLFRGLTDDG